MSDPVDAELLELAEEIDTLSVKLLCYVKHRARSGAVIVRLGGLASIANRLAKDMRMMGSGKLETATQSALAGVRPSGIVSEAWKEKP